jgi:DNA topoisomerase I
MSKNLVIVESPAKAKTIKRYLGDDYQVESCFGHIRDLPKKNLSIDIENDFTPKYEIPADKKKVITNLRKAAKDKEVWLASDEDREGEAIAWHLCHALKLKPSEAKRIVFHEITKSAISDAIKHPRTVNEKLVDAQQARRVLDRIVGYELSPVLWRKIRPGLSAGRVQSVSVRLVVEREREINAFTPESSFKVAADFLTDNKTTIHAEMDRAVLSDKEAKKLLEEFKDDNFTIKDIKKRPSTKNPSAPFTTSSLQQEAARRLGYSVRQTMTIAQRLYENGHITYMRTDSTTLSQAAIGMAEKFIAKEYGAKYCQTRQYKSKSRSAQEAHEAIRPTSLAKQTAGDNASQKKLYKLIWERTIASQMSPAKTDKTTVSIVGTKNDETFLAKGEQLQFDGFLRVYGGGPDDTLLPDLKTGEPLYIETLTATETFSRPPARYSEAMLVRKLEELGIGRPSTYAPTITTIQDRGYIEKADLEGEDREHTVLTLKDGTISTDKTTKAFGADKNKLLPTSVAMVTNDFLTKHFSHIVDYNFTAETEETLDQIAEGEIDWVKMLEDFYKEFAPLIEKSKEVSRQESTQSKQIGLDPKTGEPIFARFGKYGLMLQKGSGENDVKPTFAPMPEGKNIETVTLEDALEMFKLPRHVGQTKDGEEIYSNIGRFGPYIKVGSLYVSIKPEDPMTITEEEARKRYEEKLSVEKNKQIKKFTEKLQVLNGPYGPYVTNGSKNARIPKSIEPEKITREEAEELIKKARPARKRYRKSASKK